MSHTNATGHLKFSSALDMIQDCTHQWLDSEQYFSDYFLVNGIAMIVASRQMDVIRMPRINERLTVCTSVYDYQKFFGYRNTAIYDEKGCPCVLSWCVGVFVKVAQGKMIKLPQDVVDSLTMEPRVDMQYLDKKIPLPSIESQTLEPIPVRRSDIDRNGHMNNARYVETSMEFLPEDFEPTRLRIEYKHAARYGDILHPRLIQTARRTYLVALSDQTGKPYTVSEFSMLAE